MGVDEVTMLLDDLRHGSAEAPARLIEVVYAELRVMAGAAMRGERSGHTLQPTALVNEAYLRLLGTQDRLEDRAHFFGAAAKAMERVLVDYARSRQALKRGGGAQRVTLDQVQADAPGPGIGVLEVHEAVLSMEREDPEMASLVRQRYFIGMTLEQIADVNQVSLATMKRRWTVAKAWLYARL